MEPCQRHPRYPGAHSFSDNAIDQRLFFGREREATTLINEIRSTRLLVLYGKSGLGKTSLLNAGVFPELRRRDFLPLRLRVNDTERSQLESIIEQIGQYCATHDVDYTPGKTTSLWEFFKTALFWHGETLLTPVAVLDQFEEIFTLQTPQARTELAQQLGELMNSGLPAALLRRRRDPDEQIDDAMDYSPSPPNVKLIISLRWEYVGRLEELFPQLPAILNHRFLLQPLSRDQAEAAIVHPAAEKGDTFISPPFSYQPQALNELLDFLVDDSGGVEPFSLQLLCQHVENQVDHQDRVRETGQEPIVVDHGYLGDRVKLERILGQFYQNVVGKIENRRTQRAVRNLCEYGLLSAEGHRLDLGERRILDDYRLSPNDLEALVNQRLLRREPRLGSYSYELAHDTLAASIAAQRRFKLPRWLWVAGLVLLLMGLGLISWFFIAAQRAQIAELLRTNVTEERFTELLTQSEELTQKLTVASEQAGLLIEEGDKLDQALRAGRDQLSGAAQALVKQNKIARQTLTQAGILDDSGSVQASSGKLEPEMVPITGGCFQMGSPAGEKDRDDNEVQHEVCVGNFRIGKYEVTFAEYDTFALATKRELPSDADWGRGKRPVINVSWEDAVAYAAWLSQRTRGETYRLPTEAEWEYAARAGTETRYWWGEELGRNHANCDGCGSEWDNKQTAPVRSFEANPFGLHDTAGNVLEWTCSAYSNSYDGSESRCVSSNSGESRVLRGGSWFSDGRSLRSALRLANGPGYRYDYIGFRLARGQVSSK